MTIIIINYDNKYDYKASPPAQPKIIYYLLPLLLLLLLLFQLFIGISSGTNSLFFFTISSIALVLCLEDNEPESKNIKVFYMNVSQSFNRSITISLR